MKAYIVKIEPAELEAVFPLISRFILQGIEHSKGRVDVDSFCRMVAEGDWKLWGIYVNDEDGVPEFKAVVASELLTYPSGQLFSTVPFLGGFDIDEWCVEALTFLEGWAEAEGAVRMEIFARKGLSKHLQDYRCKNIILEKQLGKTNGKSIPSKGKNANDHAVVAA